jgi:peptide/nickel transport system substrate-binding protein
MTWDFNLRHGVHFSNGDTFNAYVMWYSLYRTLVMNQLPSFILGQNFGTSNGAGINITDATLNSINYASPSQQNLALMESTNQSFQVINQYEIVLQLGYGTNGNQSYSALLATISSPCAFAVDPSYVLAHGGVVANSPNPFMQTNALGTGFYELSSWIQGQSVKLVINPDYWAKNLTSSQLNYAIQPATLASVIVYYKPTSSRIADLKSGFAQIIGAPDVTEAASLGTIRSIPNVNVTIFPIQFGSAEAAYYVFMNPYVNPEFSNIYVREAISYAINYTGIISSVFSGLAQQWVGPVPPGFPYYNQTISGLSQYKYDPAIAAQLLAKAGYISKLPNGTKLDPSGQPFPTLNFVYTSDSVSETEVASIIDSELGSVGINVNLAPLPFPQYSNLLFSAPETSSTANGFGIGFYSEDYVASQDYVTAIASGNATGTPLYIRNISSWVTEANGATDNSTLVRAFQNITSTMLNNYVDVWLYVPDFIGVNVNNVVGMVPNPAGSCAGYFMFYNTVHYT